MLVPVTEDNIEDALLAYSPKLRKKIEAGLKDIRAGTDDAAVRLQSQASQEEGPQRVTCQVFLIGESSTGPRRVP
jgi:hypothetical protein